MDPKERVQLERLLSGGGGPSVMEREDMLQRILEAPEVSAAEPAGWRRWFTLPKMMPLMAAAMGAALLAVGLPGGSEDDPEFVARGEQRAVTTAHTPDGVEISASCAGAETSITCNAKDELLLDVDVREHRRQLGVLLFSQVSKDEGKITWFFPKAGEAAPVVEGGSTLQKLTLSAPQGQGHYLMVVVDKQVNRKNVLSKVQQVLEKAEADGRAVDEMGAEFAKQGVQMIPVQIREGRSKPEAGKAEVDARK